MSVGARLREERLRLGVSQSDFARLAGAAKNTQINWEKDASSPTAAALLAFAEVGADVSYILTGQRTEDRRADTVNELREQLERDRKSLADPQVGDDDEELGRLCEAVGNATRAMLKYDRHFITPELVAEAEKLLLIVEKVDTLRRYRIEQHKLLRTSREQAKRRIASWFEDAGYMPGDPALSMLVALATDYNVPVRTLVDLAYELHADATAS